jgi:hypothetical protein
MEGYELRTLFIPQIPPMALQAAALIIERCPEGSAYRLVAETLANLAPHLDNLSHQLRADEFGRFGQAPELGQ